MKEKENLRLSFFIQRTAKDNEGNCPVIGRSQTQFSTKIRVPDELWNTRKARLIGKSRLAVKHNRALDEISVLVHSRFRELKQTSTDQEIMTIYLFEGYCQKYFQIKDIHNLASEYLSSWFPKLPS